MADQSQYWQQQQQPGGWGQQQPWPPQQPAQPPGAGGSEVMPPKPKPTPLDPPKMFYNSIWRVPAIVVHTQEEADALDPNEWTEHPPPAGAKAADPEYPKLYFNVNVAPRIVNDADEQKALSSDWREFSLPDALCKAAEAANAAKAQKQSQGQA